jgi:heat shock protein HslJ
MRRLLPLVLVAVTGLAACGSAAPAGSDDTAASSPPSLPHPPTVPPSSGLDLPGPNDPPPTLPTVPATGDTEPGTTQPGTTEPQEVTMGALVDRRWIVEARVTIAGPQPVPAASTAELAIAADGSLTVDTGCNKGSATVTFGDDGTFTVGPLRTTKMACVDPDLAAVESTLLATLDGTVAWSVAGDRLSLTPTMMSDTGLQLRDAESSGTSVPEPGLDQSALVGPVWVVERFITVGPLDPVPDGVIARIEFSGLGAIFVETGCNSGSGQVRFDADGTFTVIQLSLTEKACDGDAGAVETRVLAQLRLGTPLLWSVQDDQLTIYPSDISDTGMILRAT